MPEEVGGAAAAVYVDAESGHVVVEYLFPDGHPKAGQAIVEICVTPAMARELAFTLTTASYALEE